MKLNTKEIYKILYDVFEVEKTFKILEKEPSFTATEVFLMENRKQAIKFRLETIASKIMEKLKGEQQTISAETPIDTFYPTKLQNCLAELEQNYEDMRREQRNRDLVDAVKAMYEEYKKSKSIETIDE
jgi:hypothetical protein